MYPMLVIEKKRKKMKNLKKDIFILYLIKNRGIIN